jgi:hypothetical protein
MAELPQLMTEPGFARPFYTGNARTEGYVTEAMHALGNVSLDASNPSGLQSPLYVNYQDGTPSAIPSAHPDNESIVSTGRGGLPGAGDQYGFSAPQTDEHGAFLPPPDAARFRSLSTRKRPPGSPPNQPLRDDLPSSSQGIGLPTSSGGRFATFPVKGRRQDSVGQMVAEPLDGERPPLSDVEQTSHNGDLDDVAPKYEATFGPPPGPPPGAAPPAMLHASLYPGSYDSGPSFVPDNTGEDEDDTQLPYAMSPRERKMPYGSRPLPVPRPWLPTGREAESSEEPHGSSPMTTELDPFPDSITPSASIQGLNMVSTSPAAAEDPDDERALNAAAAREVSRELDSLMYQPPTRELPPPPFAPQTPNTPPAVSPRSSGDSAIPASSPFARARGPVSGSPSVPRSSLEQPSPMNGPPSPSEAEASSETVQQAQLPPPSIVLARPSSPSLSSINFRTPPEFPPNPSPGSSQRSLPQSPRAKPPPPPRPPPRQGTAGMISVAAFRRPPPGPPPPRTGTEPPVSDVNPLSIKKRGSPNAPRTGGTFSPTSSMPGALPPQLSPPLPQEQHQDDEFDYISAYYSAGGGDEAGSPPSYTEARARSGSLR